MRIKPMTLTLLHRAIFHIISQSSTTHTEISDLKKNMKKCLSFFIKSHSKRRLDVQHHHRDAESLSRSFSFTAPSSWRYSLVWCCDGDAERCQSLRCSDEWRSGDGEGFVIFLNPSVILVLEENSPIRREMCDHTMKLKNTLLVWWRERLLSKGRKHTLGTITHCWHY